MTATYVSAEPRVNQTLPSRAPWLGLSTYVCLGVAAPWLMIGGDPRTTAINLSLSILVVNFSAARLAFLIYRGEPKLLALTFYIFVYSFLGLALTAQVASRHFPLDNATYPDAAITRGLIMITLGILAYEIGRMFASGPVRPSDPNRAREFAAGRATLLGILGILFVFYTVASTGISPFFTSRETAESALAGYRGTEIQVYELSDKAGYILRGFLLRIPIFLALMSLVWMRLRGQWPLTKAARSFATPILIALVGANLLVNNFLSNSRFWFGLVVITFATLFIPFQRARGFRILAFSCLFIFVFAFSLLDAFRRSTVDERYAGPREALTADGSYSAFQTMLNGLRWTDLHGHTWGDQISGSLLSFIPSSIWPNKPMNTGRLIDSHFNRTATLWTEFHVDFGLAGLIVLFLLYGAGSAWLERRLSMLTGAAAMALPLLAGCQLVLLRGSMLNSMTTIYPLMCFFFLITQRAPSDAAPTSVVRGGIRRGRLTS